MESNSAGMIPTPDAAPRRAARRLYRSPNNRVFSGVCAGVAEYWGGDPTMVRLATVIIGLLTGIIPMTVLYIIGAIIVPERDATAGLEPAAHATPARSGNGTLIAGIFFIAIGFLGFMHEVVGIDSDLLWPFALIGIGAGFILLTLRR
jgi:phage shock protein PspC (stress-responsive transcriptional regulator)